MASAQLPNGTAASDETLMPEQLAVTAIAPLDREASLSEKVIELATNLAIADTLDATRLHSLKENPTSNEGVSSANLRYPTRVALTAIMEFLIAAGLAKKGGGPKTLWRLLAALAELDDSGNVSPLFHSIHAKKKGKRTDTLAVGNLKVVAAVGMEIAQADCFMPRDQASAYVARKLAGPRVHAMLGNVDGGRIAEWRDKCAGHGVKKNKAWAALYERALQAIRDAEQSPERRLKRALYGLQITLTNLCKF